VAKALRQSSARLQVLLVGGATRMPAVVRAVANMTGLRPRPGLTDADAAVAAGAALHAAALSGLAGDAMLLDTWQAELMRALAAGGVSADDARFGGGGSEPDDPDSSEHSDAEPDETPDQADTRAAQLAGT
jgi:sugar (pentulose or hexulose) kinase